MKRFLRNNGLTLVLLAVFLLSWAGQFFAGLRTYNQDRTAHGRPPVSAADYSLSGHFWQATGENWESEFLQMAMFTLLTAFLFQKGSPDSNDPDEAPQGEAPAPPPASAPWPVRKGGLSLRLYRHSLSIAFLFCFVGSVVIHALGGVAAANEENVFHGQPSETLGEHVSGARFWFESFQNWQSEFLSLAAMVFLSVYLREAGSAESKKVSSPHDAHE